MKNRLHRPSRQRVKRTAERLLAGAGLPRLGRALRARCGLVLAYHNIVPDDAAVAGDASLHLPRRAFAEQLDLLARHYDIVPLDALLRGGRAGGGRPRVAITFDDAYRGAVTLGAEELARRGMPATIFVAPALLGRGSFWWDALAERGGGLREDFRGRALEECRGEDEAVRNRAAELGLQARSVPCLAAASEAELARAAERPGITLGSHSWSHPNLAALAGPELEEQLARPLEWLRERFASVIPWLSYPYGRSSPAVERRAAATGYRAALRIGGGALPSRPRSPYALPRVNIPAGLSPSGFALRAAGLTGG